ncbi:MAG: hypothetical protein GY778_01530, partial [bacterium]|nr:hypothetical protein [bacterium]
RWTGGVWEALGTGMGETVHALAEYDGALVAGGAFTEAGGEIVDRLARWEDGIPPRE